MIGRSGAAGEVLTIKKPRLRSNPMMYPRYRYVDCGIVDRSAQQIRRSLGNETRGGQIPNGRQADHGCKKADQENVQRVGVGVVGGVGHGILLEHDENRKAPLELAR